VQLLSDLAVAIRRLVYDGAIERCAIPNKGELTGATGGSTEAVDGALRELADAHMLVLQRDSGEVLMANPFSAVPTPFVVTIGARRWYANCIWDSMGLAAMLGSDARLDASCGCCGTALNMTMPRDCRDDDERVAHFAIPAARWWDDIVYN
jgi:hypothetical protein